MSVFLFIFVFVFLIAVVLALFLIMVHGIESSDVVARLEDGIEWSAAFCH